jgi:saccharopine dehydrogenase-like NADP-dependent oxidoreductase
LNQSEHTVLILGGYGFFGQRIATALSKQGGIRTIIAGRRLSECKAVAVAIALPAENAVELDANDPKLAERLRELHVSTLIHTAGPFQNQDYVVARAAIEAKCNYIDLADGREFVANVEQLHSLASDANITVISGASSVPALSSAVINYHLPLFKTLESVRYGIASGARAPGIATMKGVFGYCGKPIHRLVEGMWSTTYGWLDIHRHAFPAPVGKRWLGSCDIPDLALFPKYYPSLKTVVFYAGFASSIGHLTVWFLASLVKAGMLKSVVPFAPMFSRISKWMEPMTSNKGAMFVELEGVGLDEQPLKRTWTLIAAQNHGPHIPCGAAIALAKKLATGDVLPKGAMPCIGLLTVSEYLDPILDLDLTIILS